MKCPHCHKAIPTQLGQGRLFARPNYEGARKGMSQVEQAANEEWKAEALKTLYQVAAENEFLTVDDVSRAIPEEVQTHDARALGPIMMRGKKEGWLEHSDRFTPSVRSTRHATHTIIWRSLIWREKHERQERVPGGWPLRHV